MNLALASTWYTWQISRSYCFCSWLVHHAVGAPNSPNGSTALETMRCRGDRSEIVLVYDSGLILARMMRFSGAIAMAPLLAGKIGAARTISCASDLHGVHLARSSAKKVSVSVSFSGSLLRCKLATSVPTINRQLPRPISVRSSGSEVPRDGGRITLVKTRGCQSQSGYENGRRLRW